MSSKFFLKNNTKIPLQRLISSKISTKLSSLSNSFRTNQSSLSLSQRRIKSKTKLLINSILKTSKRYLIKGKNSKPSKDIINNFSYIYPYKPDGNFKLENIHREKNILYNDNSYNSSNILTNSVKLCNMPSVDNNNSLSTFNNSIKNNNSSFNFSKKYISLKRKFFMKNINKDINKINISNFSDIINDLNDNNNKLLNRELFLKYIDNINTDKNYLNKYKKELNDYFNVNINNKNNINTQNNGKKIMKAKKNFFHFQEVLNNYNYEDVKENEKENYFIKNNNYMKKNNFFSNDLDITFKLSSLKLNFYEIIKTNNSSGNKENHLLNSKIKFPFEFLSIFYGLNFDDFLSLLTALIDYDFIKNKFYIDYNNFITKIENAKILYDFYNVKSYINIYDSNDAKEFFIYDWDVKGKDGKIKYYYIKILLPRIKIKVKYPKDNKIIFYSCTSAKIMDKLIKNDFNNWDFYILVYFLHFKLFRHEINKIICKKYLNINESIFPNQNLAKQSQNNNSIFNLTNTIIKLNTHKKNYKSYNFFYSYNKAHKCETYFFSFYLPKIFISFHNFDKNFEVDYRRLHQLNKLRKYFIPEHIIKYSMIVETSQIEEIPKEFQKPSLKKHMTARASKKPSITLKINKGRRRSTKQFLKKLLKEKNEMSVLNSTVQNDQIIKIVVKDINLNLDKYIFNFDESILKFIHIKDNYKEDAKNDSESSNNYPTSFKKQKILNINVDTLQLSWTNREGLTNTYKFDKKESEYLFDFIPEKWKTYVEKNIDKIITKESYN